MGIQINGQTDSVTSSDGSLSIGGNVTIPGVLTYEDVTSVDAVGLSTFQAGANVTGGRLLVGHNTSVSVRQDSKVQISSTDATAAISVARYSNDSSAPFINLGKSRGALGGTTVVQDGDGLGRIAFVGADGSDLLTEGAAILAQVDGAPGSDDMPGRLSFRTTADGASSPTERLRITSDGKVCIGSASDEDLEFGTDVTALLQLSHESAPKLILCRDDTSVTTNDYLGIIDFHSRDGGIKRVARIGARAGGNHGADDGPTDLVFHTMGDNTATTAEERLRITYGGLIGVNVTPTQQKLTIDVNSSGTTPASFDGINICNTDTTTNNGAAIVFGQAIAGNSYARIGVINSDRSGGSEDQDIFFGTLGGGSYGERLRITSTGAVLPGDDATQDLGSSSKRWANIYSADLQLSNEGSNNDVDGTWGQYTIQEGEDDLFLINRRSGKKYKFMLQEVN